MRILNYAEAHFKNLETLGIVPIYKFSNLFGFAPLYDFKRGAEKYQKWYQVYSAFMGVVVVASFLYHGSALLFLAADWDKSIIIPAAILSLLLHAFNLLSILNQAFLNRHNWILMLTTMNETDFKLLDKTVIKIMVSVSYTLFTGVILYECYIWWMFINKDTILAFICVNLQEVLSELIVYLICYVALHIKCRYKHLCRLILSQNVFIYVEENRQPKLDLVINTYNKLTLFVELFNKIFGVCNLIYVGVVLTGLLDICNTYIKQTLTLFNLFDALVATTFRLAQGLLLAICCGAANDEIRNVGKIAFQVAQNFKPGSMEERRLFKMAVFSSLKSPQITAANIFEVHMTTFFGLLGSVLSYLIVILQFNETK